MKRKAPSTPTTAAIAASLKLSQRRVNQLRKEGMPVTDIESARKWYLEKSGGNSVEELRARRIEVLVETREKIKMENAIRRGKLLDADAVQESVTTTMAAARASLTKAMLDELPPRLEGLSASAIAKELKKVLLAILTQLSTAQYYDSAEVAAIVEQARAAVVKSK